MEKSKKNYIEKNNGCKGNGKYDWKKRKIVGIWTKKSSKGASEIKWIIKINGGLLCFPENRF